MSLIFTSPAPTCCASRLRDMPLEPFIDDGFEERWAAWQARGAARDRTTRRRLFVLTAILVLSGAFVTGLWRL